MKVVINPAYEYLRSFVETMPGQFDTAGVVIHQGRNVLKRFDVGGMSLIVKRFKIPHILNRFVYVTFRQSKAARSYLNALKLLEMGFATPQPIAYLQEYSFGLSYSYYVTLEAEGMSEIRCYCPESQEKGPLSVLPAFGKYTAELHKKGVQHKDYTPGNVLFKVTDNGVEFSLVDINRIEFGPVTEDMGYKNLDRLWLDDDLYKLVVLGYTNALGYDYDYAWKQVYQYKQAIVKKYGNRK